MTILYIRNTFIVFTIISFIIMLVNMAAYQNANPIERDNIEINIIVSVFAFCISSIIAATVNRQIK